jgi:hypothetical protein
MPANRKKYIVHKSQSRKLPHLRKVHKSFTKFESANLFADRPPLSLYHAEVITVVFCVTYNLKKEF